ncbi:hypothetical protein TRVL_02219 [Trypanosoma vivax]|uniref:Cold-shock domain-containing protein n=1 Tax=Trypanosoma vivax (strain Y486) TaxID=1055687 RepID=G0TYJ7_TRYVY|nr:hypothetical protein TRVL_02219 [Trypanosoma vivax]CCC49044.1 conserved hypothetical protein [Trypanosoma vivax Y486]
MLRLAAWRYAISFTVPLLQRDDGKVTEGNSSSSVPLPTSSQTAQRHVGTVTSFMHRRGYGFIRGIEFPSANPASALAQQTSITSEGDHANFFFHRSSLDGGFYVTEGQTVSFDVRTIQPGAQLNEQLARTHESVKGGPSKALSVAHRIRRFDVATGREGAITPITLQGCVESWDAISGTGVIAELDLNGMLHDDAPRFSVGLEDLDLVRHSDFRRGLYVRFCLEQGDRTAARRVIIDRAAELKHRTRSSSVSSSGRVLTDTSHSSTERFHGTVRETVDGRFGFITVNETGNSVFFHMTNVAGWGDTSKGDDCGTVKPGDIVSFVVQDIKSGKHAGKKTCLDIRKCDAQQNLVKPEGDGSDKRGLSTEDDDFDFLE